MVCRISGFEPRFTSASVGTASWSMISKRLVKCVVP